MPRQQHADLFGRNVCQLYESKKKLKVRVVEDRSDDGSRCKSCHVLSSGW